MFVDKSKVSWSQCTGQPSISSSAGAAAVGWFTQGETAHFPPAHKGTGGC